MLEITDHPILTINKTEEVHFSFNGEIIAGESGKTIAAALHRAGHPVHSESLSGRHRSLECGIGKCGACEMLVDGKIARICITKVDGVKTVAEIPKEHAPEAREVKLNPQRKVYKTTVGIIGAGPAGLAAREELMRHGVKNIVIDNNDKIGGQFTMQTHQFFFFEQAQRYGGMRGFDIASKLAGDNREGIFLNSTVWDILDGGRLAIKNVVSGEIYYLECDYLIVATGAVPFMPAFKNDDLPGVYTAAVVQKMMNNELTLLGKNVLTVGAGNIGYLTSYQLMQAGANVKAIIEAQDKEGGFPVQANRLRRLGVPIMTSHILIEALPNRDKDGIVGAIVAECENFKPIPGTEKIITGIDTINICTGLVPDDQLFTKGKEVFGRNCYGIGDAFRIGEGTTAVLHGKQIAYEILRESGARFRYDDYLTTAKEYIDSQQHPNRLLNVPQMPAGERLDKPFVIADCLYGFACNPCKFACKKGAISKNSSADVPKIDYELCSGCMDCVWQCPGLAIFGYNLAKKTVFLPIEFNMSEGIEVFLVDNNGVPLGEGILEKVIKKANKTNLARVKANDLEGIQLTNVRGFIPKDKMPAPLEMTPLANAEEAQTYVCHCDDVTLEEILEVIGDRKFISIDEVKHTTRLGMGACRGKRCSRRLRSLLAERGISLFGEPTPRAPLSNQVELGELYPSQARDKYIFNLNGAQTKRVEVPVLIAGGGIGGSALFRYFAEAGMKPTLLNYERGSSWRNIAGGRPAFSLPEIADIARRSHEIFKSIHKAHDIHYRLINYVNFAHDEDTYNALDKSREWSDAYMVEPRDFKKHISPRLNEKNETYLGALITRDCWQATPGRVIDYIRQIGVNHGGTVAEDCQLIDVSKSDNGYIALAKNHAGEYVEYHAERFVNAAGAGGAKFAKALGIDTGLYPVKHQAFITRRLPMLGVDGEPLGMLIDRRNYKGFNAVYGQQLGDTGQIIGCASPALEPTEVAGNLKINSQEFLEISAEVFAGWIPELANVSFQAVWAGYYVEPRLIIDPELGLLLGLRGHGYMLGQGLAKMYVDSVMGREVPEYFPRMALSGDGLLEKAFK